MSREVLGESLSAVMDGEADELELRRVLGAAGEDPELRARWARYQLVRSVMHKQAVRPGLDLAAAVSAAIAVDEAPLEAPAAAPARRGWSQVGRLAVAASVALAVLAGVRFYNAQNDATVVAPQLAQEAPQAQPAAVQPALPVVTAPKGPAMLASYPESDDEEQAPPPAAADDSQIIREVPRGTQVQPAAAPAGGAGAR